jgi:daunorubicin resistance ABC transporter membrane protein
LTDLRLDLATIRVLTRRELTRFFRQRSRIFGAVAQPLLFWLVIGTGLAGYREFFYPGVLVMVVLFTSIFATMTLIEDRHSGFLQAVLTAPSSRPAVVLGKTLGGVVIAMVQAGLFLLLAPVAGVSYGEVAWLPLLGLLTLLALGLTAFAFAFAWWLDNQQGFHAVMMVLLMPSWVLSGAIFPVEKAEPWLAAIMRGNPVTYGVAGVRGALAGAAPTGGQLAAVALFAAASLALATLACSRRR